MSRIRHLLAPLASSRSLLSLTGNDASKFLQGLVTNDILASQQASTEASTSASPAVYAGFLSAQGRVQHDTFILPSNADGKAEYIVDYPKKATTPPLLNYIKRYILRSKVKVRQLDEDWRLWAIFPDPLAISRSPVNLHGTDIQVENELDELTRKYNGRWWRDSRSSKMGYRLLLPTESLSALTSTSWQSATPSLHTLLRTICNVPEAPSELIPGHSLPLESNMDFMGGVDYRKGCYIGQELTARTHHTGVIRKRLVPFRLYKHEESRPETLLPGSWQSINDVEELTLPGEVDVKPLANTDGTGPRRPRPAGRIHSLLRVTSSESQKEAYLGLALLRLEMLSTDLISESNQTNHEEKQVAAGVGPSGGLKSAPPQISVDGFRVAPFSEGITVASSDGMTS